MFVQFLWNLVKMITSWGNNFHQVSWGLEKSCGFFINGQFLKVCHFFTQTLHVYILFFRYYGDWHRAGNLTALTNVSDQCDNIEEINQKDDKYDCDNLTNKTFISIHCFPKEQYFPAVAKFAYTMFFLLIPWPFFIYEFFTSRQYHIFVNQWRDIVKGNF